MVVDPFDRWPDPEREVAEFIRADPGLFAAEVAAAGRATGGRRVGARPARGGGPRSWQAAEERGPWAIADRLGHRRRRPH